VVGMIEVTKLKTHPNNVKEHPEKQIKNLMQLMKWVGFKDPIVIDKENNLKAGHGRIIAAERLGMKKVPFVRLEGLTKKQMDLFIYMDNQINESPWIKDNVELLLKDIPMQDLEMFDLEWDGIRKVDYKEETDPVPEPPIQPKAKLGQIYELGNHRIMCGDATKDTEKLINGITVHLLLTDPPFNLNYDFNNNGMVQTGQRTARFGKMQNDNMTDDEFHKFLNDVFPKIIDVLRKGGSFYIFGRRESTMKFNQVLESINTHIQSWLVWKKDNFNISRFDYHPKHEIITYGWKKGKHDWHSDRSQTDVLEFKRNMGKSVHPTQKPVELLAYLINNSSKKNKMVLDPFLGSGSTLIACEQTGRICYGMEIDPAYIDVIITRWENFTGKKAKLL